MRPLLLWGRQNEGMLKVGALGVMGMQKGLGTCPNLLTWSYMFNKYLLL